MTKQSVQEKVTAKILEMLEAGTAPWSKPWKGYGFAPRNLISGKRYRGINVFMLEMVRAEQNFPTPFWLTYKQAQDLGGNVRKGEKGTMVVFFKPLKREDKAGKETTIPLWKSYTLFNACQCDGVNHKRLVELTEAHTGPDFDPIAKAEEISEGYAGAPEVTHGEDRAYYQPSTDAINMPKRNAFDQAGEYYSTLFHEYGHSTGHKSRLDRKTGFGKHEYSEEELVAEFSSAYLCAEAGIETTIENSAAYLAGWIKVIKADSRLVMRAASAAQRAADHILGAEATA